MKSQKELFVDTLQSIITPDFFGKFTFNASLGTIEHPECNAILSINNHEKSFLYITDDLTVVSNDSRLKNLHSENQEAFAKYCNKWNELLEPVRDYLNNSGNYNYKSNQYKALFK